LVRMKGKLFRPTLLLLSHQAGGAGDPRAVTLGAVVELIHLATLVHDDSVDHSVLRRGMPTVNALFSHQVAVIMGDYLYSRAIIELVALDVREALARFGEHLGMAFQITDDLLDYTESEEVTGKPVGLDLKEHKVTLPLIAALGQMGQRERRVVADLMVAPDPPDDLVGEVIGLV